MDTNVLVKLARDLTNRPIGPQKVVIFLEGKSPTISGKSRFVKYLENKLL